MKWLLNLFRKKDIPEPDVSVMIDLYRETGHIVIRTLPDELTDEQILTMLDLAMDMVEEQNPIWVPEADIEDIIERQLSAPKPPKLRRIK